LPFASLPEQPSFRAQQWVRVISVSDSLEIRVRHDQRDMLLQKLERHGIADFNAPAIRAQELEGWFGTWGNKMFEMRGR